MAQAKNLLKKTDMTNIIATNFACEPLIKSNQTTKKVDWSSVKVTRG